MKDNGNRNILKLTSPLHLPHSKCKQRCAPEVKKVIFSCKKYALNVYWPWQKTNQRHLFANDVNLVASRND